MQITLPFLCAKGIVQFLVNRVELLVNLMRPGIRLVNFRFQAGHFFLGSGKILMRAGNDGGGDGRAERAGLGRA